MILWRQPHRVRVRTFTMLCALFTKWAWFHEPRKIIFGKDLLCANSDDWRFKHLKKALYAKDSKVVWSLRGGYGSLRLFPALAKLKKPPANEIIYWLQ